MKKITTIFLVLHSLFSFAQCQLNLLAGDLSKNNKEFKEIVNDASGFNAWQILEVEATALRTNVDELTLVSKNLEAIKSAKGYLNWKAVKGAGKFSITKLDDYLKGISTRNPAGAIGSPPRVYQESVTTGIEYELKGGANSKIWADGLDKSTGTVIEAKFISNPNASTFVEGSSCYPPVRQKILDEVTDEFRRYSEIIKDPNTPLVQLEVFVSDASGVPYFQKLLNDFSIPGKVTVKP